MPAPTSARLQTAPDKPRMTDPRLFARSRNDRMIAGVLGGIAHRYRWSPAILRIAYVLVSIASIAFPGILVYLILWLLMPEEGLA